MARSLNKVQLIGNLTRDPELRYTPNGRGVCTFGIATNRSWTTDSGEKREEVEFHNIVAWGKLGELCSQFLAKGRKVYVEGRLATRSWTGQDGAQKQRTEIVIDDMLLLDNKGAGVSHTETPRESASESNSAEAEEPTASDEPVVAKASKKKKEEEGAPVSANEQDVMPDDIPF